MRRVLFQVHRWTGILAGLYVFVILYFVFPTQVRSVVNRISPITVRRPPLSYARSQPRQVTSPSCIVMRWTRVVRPLRKKEGAS